jgi:CheY-like chemotaxis protein
VTDTDRIFPILMADDDEDDCLLTERAFQRVRVRNELHFVKDGAQLLAFLRQEGPYHQAPRPGLILLDLNMPKKDGREALAEIKADPALRSIPVVVLTTSKAEEDIFRTYDQGAASFVTKPVTFEGLVEAVVQLRSYWVEFVEVPDGARKR